MTCVALSVSLCFTGRGLLDGGGAVVLNGVGGILDVEIVLEGTTGCGGCTITLPPVFCDNGDARLVTIISGTSGCVCVILGSIQMAARMSSPCSSSEANRYSRTAPDFLLWQPEIINLVLF